VRLKNGEKMQGGVRLGRQAAKHIPDDPSFSS